MVREGLNHFINNMQGKAFLHFLKYLIRLEKACTQTTQEEMELIKKYAAQKKYVVEIGVYEAVNTVSIAKAISRHAVFFAIDPFFKSKFGFCYYKWITQLNLLRNRVSNKVRLLEVFSYEAAKNIDSKIDFIFVDGDHSYEGIQKDWNLYSTKVVLGGYILLHDTSVPAFDLSRAYLGSVTFFKEIISKDSRFILLDTVDSLNVLQRIN